MVNSIYVLRLTAPTPPLWTCGLRGGRKLEAPKSVYLGAPTSAKSDTYQGGTPVAFAAHEKAPGLFHFTTCAHATPAPTILIPI